MPNMLSKYISRIITCCWQCQTCQHQIILFIAMGSSMMTSTHVGANFSSVNYNPFLDWPHNVRWMINYFINTSLLSLLYLCVKDTHSFSHTWCHQHNTSQHDALLDMILLDCSLSTLILNTQCKITPPIY